MGERREEEGPLAVRAGADDAARAQSATRWLGRTGATAGALLVLTVAAPIGQRAGVDTADGATGSAGEGNVPRLVGLTAADAEKRLDDAELDASFVWVPTDDDTCKVTGQDPEAGAELDQYESVKLRCHVRIPRVAGRRADKAQDRLSEAGFDVRVSNEPSDFDYQRCRVRTQSRRGSAPPRTTVWLRLRCRPPQRELVAQPEPQDDCDPNYEGACLSPSSPDYDCEGNGGDGPDYTGYVTVVGEDHYGLDGNGDDEGCE